MEWRGERAELQLSNLKVSGKYALCSARFWGKKLLVFFVLIFAWNEQKVALYITKHNFPAFSCPKGVSMSFHPLKVPPTFISPLPFPPPAAVGLGEMLKNAVAQLANEVGHTWLIYWATPLDEWDLPVCVAWSRNSSQPCAKFPAVWGQNTRQGSLQYSFPLCGKTARLHKIWHWVWSALTKWEIGKKDDFTLSPQKMWIF